MIAQLVAAFREHPESICDGDTLGEMITFQYNQDRRPEAMAGEHDDLVMALAIAHYIRTQQEVLDEPEPGMTALWTRDMREDYARADEEGRRVLEGLWGKPR
jgi:phage terminase large subunit